MDVKQMIITILIGLAFMGIVLTVSANRTSKIDNGEMTLVNQNQMK